MSSAGPSVFCHGGSCHGGSLDHGMGPGPPFLLGPGLESMTHHRNIMRLENFTFRIRKGPTSGDMAKKGPMIAKHPTVPLAPSPPPSPLGGDDRVEPSVSQMMKMAPPLSRCRTPPAVPVTEGFRPRKRSPSITRSRPSSPGNGSNRRPPSPGALDPAVLEAVKRRVRRVGQARLYLLQQPGPNSFLVGGDSPDHKYKVVIGPQTCSCGRSPHCLHLLFVMLRVFQVPESDSRIYSKELKNFEVESLFQNYQDRRNSRVNGSPDSVRRESPLSHSLSDSSSTTMSDSSSRITVEASSLLESKNVEEELCPICLLEMVDGESLVSCKTGCHNKLHHHCMAIWAVECKQHSELVLCPLCRRPWQDVAKTPTYGGLINGRKTAVSPHTPRKHFSSSSSHSPMLPNTVSPQMSRKCSNRASPHNSHRTFISMPKSTKPGVEHKAMSPSNAHCSFPSLVIHRGNHLIQDVFLPHTGSIPSEQMSIAGEWIKVFGVDVVSCLYSRDWKSREMALRRLVNDMVLIHQSDNEEQQRKVIWCCAKILTMVAADPVFKVYLGCVRCFRVLLSYGSCSELSDLIRPIVRTLLLKCADRNRRTSHLSTEVLVELAKGQSGELALGCNSSLAMAADSQMDPLTKLDGLELVLGCILEDWCYETTSWQWLAGRLIMLDRLIRDFPKEFGLQYVPLYPNESGYKLRNYNRLITVVEFALKALRSTHGTVSKLARHVFVVSASMTGVERGVFGQVLDMLAGLDPALQARLRKRLQIASEHHLPVTPVKEHPLKASRLVASLNQPGITERRYSKMDAPLRPHCLACGNTTPTSTAIRPRDLPLDLTKARTRKPVKFQQLATPSPIKRWGASGSKLYNLFTRTKKLDEILPSKPDLCQVASSPRSDEDDNSTCSFNEPQVPDLYSKILTPTTPTSLAASLDSTPVQEALSDFPQDCQEELIIPLCLSELNSPIDWDLPFIPGLQSPIEPILLKSHSQNQNMESGMKYNSYLEDVDWKRGYVLGTGAFSTCYQARDNSTGTLMAVKQVPFCRNIPEEQEIVELGIREEIVTMSKLSHTNIVRILGATKQGSHFNMFVEWMAGGSVANMLDKYGPFNNDVIILYTKQILDGLSYLHDNHILHRDLKGANLLVDSSGQHLRIGDFGASARLVSQATVSGEFQGQLLGTIAFMAPEVLRGEDYGRSCDIWSVGCCMIEMASTKPPWKENCMSNHLALMYKIASSKDPPFIPNNISWGVKDLALHCLRVNSELRPSAKELLLHCCFKCNR